MTPFARQPAWAEPVHLAGVVIEVAAVDLDALLHPISTYQAPLRDLRIHGMAMLMIFASGFPLMLGLGPYRAKADAEKRACLTGTCSE